MRKNIILTAVLVIALCLIGCGNGKTDESKGTPATEEKKDDSKTPTAAVEKNSMTFSSSEISGDGFTLSHVEATKHNMQTGDLKYTAIIIQLANYDRGDSSWHPNPKEDGQRRVTVNFSAPSGQELKVGMYKIDGKMAEDFYLSVGIEGRINGTTKNVGLYNGEGTGEITHIDDKTISGKIDLKDSKGTTITATFTTPYTKFAF